MALGAVGGQRGVLISIFFRHHREEHLLAAVGIA
jgi:hypothetical protein